MRKGSYMKKYFIVLYVIIISFFLSQAFSDEDPIQLYINQTEIITGRPAISYQNTTFIPMISTFEVLGAQVYEKQFITAYYLNSFVKVDLKNGHYFVNGKKFVFQQTPFYKDEVLYVPIEVLIKGFDLIEESKTESSLFLKANTVIKYRYFDNIQYKQIAFDDQGARFSIPLDWMNLETARFGYDSNYGRISMDFSSVVVNPNLAVEDVIRTFEEHLLIKFPRSIRSVEKESLVTKHLTSNVLHIEIDVNGKLRKKIAHFITSEDRIYILDFEYPEEISNSYIQGVITNILSSFHLNAHTFNPSEEHYFETQEALDLNLFFHEELYANMTVENKFLISGSFKHGSEIESLTLVVKRKDEQVEFYLPVENDHFEAWIYTPFGLGKHDIQLAITGEEEKIVLGNTNLNSNQVSKSKDLLFFSVVNISTEPLRYLIPTKMVQSDHEYITSMSQLITYKSSTLYGKASSVYTFVKENIDVLTVNTVNYTALDVYENYEGTRREIAYYTTALLRAQNIPTRIIHGQNDFISHYWVEAFLNGRWFIIDPTGDEGVPNLFGDEDESPLMPNFNPNRNAYDVKYPNQNIINH